MVIFDSRWISSNGIGRFAEEIHDRLAFINYYNSNNPASPLDPFKLSLDKELSNKELFFSPGYNAPLFSRIPYVFTIHDLNHIDRDENSSILKRIYYKTILTLLTKRSKAILTVSEFSKSRIVEYFNLPSDKVFVVGNGVSSVFTTIGDKVKLDFPYVLCVSNRRGHKNEVNLIKAFINSTLFGNVKLVFTGKKNRELNSLLTELNATEQIIFTGKVSDEQLAQYYRGAEFSIFPSLYEGFGLPIVESFACGTAVITSNITSMPEISGDAAILVDPNSVDSISSAMNTLMDSPALKEQLIKKGLERAKLYTWENVISSVQRVFDSLGYKVNLKSDGK